MSRLKVMSTRTFSRPAFFNLLSFLPSGSILPWVLKNNNNNWISLAPYGHNIRGTEGIWHYCLVAQYPCRVGLIRGMATLPQGNQELLEVRDKVGRPQVNLGWASPWNVIFFPSVLWHCWLGARKGSCHHSIILCFNKHWLSQIHLENGR